jgi:transcriptional regulator with XRE-family HTH domain
MKVALSQLPDGVFSRWHPVRLFPEVDQMIFSEKLQLLRKNKGLTQEETAEKLNVSRQAVAKWESGQAYPDIANLIRISDLLNVSVDYLVRDQDCSVQAVPARQTDVEKLIAFRLEANVNTYAAFKTKWIQPGRSPMISGTKMAAGFIMTHTSAENVLPVKKPSGIMGYLFMP